MSFNQDNFSPIGANSSNGPRFWSYRTTDPMSEVLAVGYFSQKKYQLEDGDFIYIDNVTRTVIGRYEGEEKPMYEVSPSEPKTVLFAGDETIQEPTATDTPLQIKYGPSQGDDDSVVKLDALGNITINQDGVYDFIGTYDFGRVGSSGGVSKIFFRGLVNGVPFGRAFAVDVDSPSIVIPLQFEVTARLKAGDIVTTEIYLDSSGVNEGGLYPEVSTIGWGVSPSANVRLTRIAR